MAIDRLAYEGLTNAHSRRKFLKKVGMTGGGLMAMGIVGEGLSLGVAAAQTANSDLDTVTFAYTLELVAVDAYTTAAKSGLLSPGVVAVGTKFAGQHQEHANALKAALEGAKAPVPAKPAKINYPAFKDEKGILEFALTLESAAVGAYYGAAGGFTNRDLASAAASIVGVEATHVALLSAALGKDPFPNAFEIGTPFAMVQKIAGDLLAVPAGQGGAATTPAKAPASGLGGSKSGDDLTGLGIGVGSAGVMAAAAAALVIFNKRNKTAEATQTDRED